MKKSPIVGPVEDGPPPPGHHHLSTKRPTYPFADMKVGQSFTISTPYTKQVNDRLHRNASAYRRKVKALPEQFAIKVGPDPLGKKITRVWRVA